MLIVGRAATSLAPADGVEIVSDPPSIAGFLERAKVAVAPLRIGTGVPNKVLEAATAGAAIVLTPEANAGLGLSPKAVATATTTEGFVTDIASLLGCRERRIELVETARQELARFDLGLLAWHYDDVLHGAADHARQAKRDSTERRLDL